MATRLVLPTADGWATRLARGIAVYVDPASTMLGGVIAIASMSARVGARARSVATLWAVCTVWRLGHMGLGRWYDDLRRREDCRRAWFVFRLDTGCGVVCVLMGTRSMCAGSTGTHHAIAVPYTISEVSTRAPVRHSDEEGHRCYRYPHISLVAAGTATVQGVFLSRQSTADY